MDKNEMYFLVHYRIGWFRWAYAAMNRANGSVVGIAKVRAFTEDRARRKLITAFNALPQDSVSIEGILNPVKIKFRMTNTGVSVHVVGE